MLHTPLMSGTNAIHGIVLLGGLIVVGAEDADTLVKIAGTVAVVFGTINIVGGFLVTDRMLEMFKGRKKPGEGGRKDSSLITRQLPPRPRLHQLRLPGRVGAVHPRHPRPEPPAHGSPGQHHRLDRDVDRGRGHAAPPRCRELRADRGRHRDRSGDRSGLGARREDDRDAADGGAVQRRRRRCGRAGRAVGVPRADPRARRDPARDADSRRCCRA